LQINSPSVGLASGQLQQLQAITTPKQMHMCLDKPRQNGAALGVYAQGIWPGKTGNIGTIAHRDQALARHRQGRGPGAGGVHGQDRGVLDDQIC
jgi:hypothetical protein